MGFWNKDKNRSGGLFPVPKQESRPLITKARLILAAAGLLFAYSIFSGATGFVQIAKLHLEKSRLEQDNQELLARLVDFEITRKRLQDDQLFIEYIARTRHFLSRPGEIIYRFKN
jgi:cell division protein FtsB